MSVQIKRVYEEPSDDDGFRVLVDRLWPRGVSKENAAVDLWSKEVAPSPSLRKAYHHEGMGWESFRARYEVELDGNDAVGELRERLKDHDVVTLLYATDDEEHNHAVLLRQRLTD
ncbi:DUF488 family protein [Tessaracoccus rhinocerotis]|uniref:DUF488 family protein n=1 Tax=Tessaracoccus rhinocerotis TaxID=1689449 RepID=A0A553JW79_9ACTN|nr:DUF488 family protein [Tessaracoccus rhinocerotis]TRY16727.1 DUF488 family protein [Tessaracoccus rhinocerotis]